MKRKRNGFFTFIFSFMPGAVEMYMGFMKNGLSIMAIFLGSIFVPMWCQLESVFLLLVVLTWFYGFFHARNMASYPAEALPNLPDEYVWTELIEKRGGDIFHPALRKWCAAILLIGGGSMLWSNMRVIVSNLIPDFMWSATYYIYDKIPQIVVAVLIIVIGIRMIRGKKEEIRRDGE